MTARSHKIPVDSLGNFSIREGQAGGHALFVFVNQFFWPDEAATSQLLGDVVSECSRLGPVAVICGAAEYGASGGAAAPEGVAIWRVRTLGFGHGRARKIGSYASFVLGALWKVLFGPRAAVMVTMTTPPLLGLLGWVGQLRGARHYIWEMDVYPDVAVELGVFSRGGFWDLLIGRLADFPRRRADGVGLTLNVETDRMSVQIRPLTPTMLCPSSRSRVDEVPRMVWAGL